MKNTNFNSKVPVSVPKSEQVPDHQEDTKQPLNRKSGLLVAIVIAVCGLSWGTSKAIDYIAEQRLKSEQVTLHDNNKLLRASNDTMRAQIQANEAQIEANSARWNEIEVELKK